MDISGLSAEMMTSSYPLGLYISTVKSNGLPGKSASAGGGVSHDLLPLPGTASGHLKWRAHCWSTQPLLSQPWSAVPIPSEER